MGKTKEVSPVIHRTKHRVLELPTESIRPNPMQPRQVFEEAGIRDLAESIRRHGILQPLTVRRTATGWELVAGERRLRAAKLAGLSRVPCLETEADDRRSALLALVENLQRRDLHYFEEADRPQTKLDRNLENGMAVSIGRLRPDTQYDYKFVCLSHNTLRGAAGGAVLLAELLAAEGYMG